MSINTKLFKNTSIYAIGDILPKLFSLIIFPVLTSHLSPAEYGIINYINTIDTFLSVLSVLSLNTYFLVYYFKVEGEVSKKKLMGNISLSVFLFSIILLLILHLIGPWLFSSWGGKVNFYPYISLGIFINLFNIVTFLPSALYRVQERPLPLTLLNVVKSLSIMLGSVFAVTYFNGQALEVLQMRLYISFFFAIVFIFSVRKDLILNINFPQLKQALKFSLPLLPGALSFYLFSLFDRILIDKYLTLRELGIYSTAATLALMLNIVSNGAYKAFEPFIFQNYSKPDFTLKFKKIRDILLLAILIGSLCLSVFSKDFFKVFSSHEYLISYKYVPIIIIGVIASSMSLMYSTIIIAKGKTVTNTLITFFGAFVSISLNVLFLKHYGIMASAITFALSFTLVLIANIIAARIRITHTRQFMASVFVITSSILIAYLVQTNIIWMSMIIKTLFVCLVILITCRILKINPFTFLYSLKKVKETV